ncbi:MBL fold metallo-hydrolase [Devosia algicola]|uniref:MBL fold metallo-hydrolase n=1 Tax=Devosia algicola TaxID=3026418 RepID=A0ABY7YQF8_9HYPH|nr:MBL fold metallo-hydrolase [Devosia algicola]WDR03558.1 MBL fold metallo-hydrolase [Devosia algicola]
MTLANATRIRFLGVAAYEIITRSGKRLLLDPFLDDNPASPVKHDSFDQVDLVIVSHAAIDHLGDTEKIVRKYNCPVICGGEVKAYLKARGIEGDQIRATTWGIRVEVAGIEVQPLECHHWSQIVMPDGTYASGLPMAFIVYADEGVRFYHYGDTAIFSDLKLHAELYRPTIGCIGIANPHEVAARFPMPGKMLTAEMSPYEGALAAEWLGLETVLPCHYLDASDPDVVAFEQHLSELAAAGRRVPRSVVLNAGDSIDVPAGGGAVQLAS